MKVFEGKVTSLGMDKTVLVEITRYKPHPLYNKLLKITKKYKVIKGDYNVEIGQKVKIGETRQVSKDKYFKIMEVLK